MRTTQKYLLPYFSLLLVLMLAAAPLMGLAPVSAAAPGPELVGTSIIADIAEASIPKVVWITATFERQVPMFPFGVYKEKQQMQGFGSGFFFDDKGDILTNAHVVAGAQALEVTLQGQKKPFPAKVIGLDRQLDLAVIRIELAGAQPFLKLGDSDKTRVGEWVIAIGNPLGLDHSVTQGIISAKGRPLVAGEQGGDATAYENMLQTDAAINPGNSGGPLLNLKGEVIGINTAVSAAGQNLGFAIPINSVKEVLSELMTKGRLSHAWLGVEMYDVKALNAKTRAYLGVKNTDGVVIFPVKGSPAEKANLQNYDVVTQMDGQDITSVEQLYKMIQKHKPGDKITLLVLRKGNPAAIDVTLEDQPQPKD